MAMKKMNDERYVIDLCDKLLGIRASRGHRFDFLRGDTGVRLPCDAYYADLKLVIEYRERQHHEVIPFFDRRMTVSGVPSGVQRMLYDQRRRDELPNHGMQLIEINCSDFECRSNRRLRRDPGDLEVIRKRLASWIDRH
jgi:hypothetical protein